MTPPSKKKFQNKKIDAVRIKLETPRPSGICYFLSPLSVDHTSSRTITNDDFRMPKLDKTDILENQFSTLYPIVLCLEPLTQGEYSFFIWFCCFLVMRQRRVECLIGLAVLNRLCCAS